MPTYSVNIDFTQSDLETIYAAGYRLVFAKSLEHKTSNVAWLVAKPYMNNLLKWNAEMYGLYASFAKVVNGAKVDIMSFCENAKRNQLYIFDADGVISGPDAGGYPDAFDLLNKFESPTGYTTLGLTQALEFNGCAYPNNVIHAIPTLQFSSALLHPDSSCIYVWLQQNIESNTVVTEIPSKVTKLTFAAAEDNINIKYDASTGSFVRV